MRGVDMNRPHYPEAAFHRAILDPQQPAPEGLIAWNGSDPTTRFDVYRNNVAVSLVEALQNTFNVVHSLVGDDFFHLMAREYLRDTLPDNPVLAYFGEGFPNFIAGFGPAASLPYLADTARLEWFRVQAYHAADAEPLSLQRLQAVLEQPEHLPSLRIGLHPSVQILDSDYAAVSLWAAHQDLMPLNRVDPLQPEAALILRPHWEVEVVAIDRPTAVFAAGLQQKVHQRVTLAEAVESTQSRHPDFDINTALVTLFKHQALLSID